MDSPPRHSDKNLKRIRLFGVLFCIIGLFFSIHSGWNLVEIYNSKMITFEVEGALTPEKGQLWSKFLAGSSVCLMGLLMIIKAGIDLLQNAKSDR